MSKANSKLASTLGAKQPKPAIIESRAIPKPDTTNRSGAQAYSQDKWLKLLTILNTSKVEPQYYRSPSTTLSDLKKLIGECAQEDLYLTCQCIVYSRCVGEGMRTISHAAGVFIAPYLSGAEFSKRFYGPWDKKAQKGGMIFRPDDMSEIIAGFVALNGQAQTTTTTVNGVVKNSATIIKGTKLTNAMKKGFRDAIESYNSHILLKYKSSLIDVINLVHPRTKESQATVKVNEEQVYTIDAIMKGMNISADTWEVNQGEAGQLVAKAVKEGKITKEEASQALTEAKADNWKELLENGSLGILAGLRNLRNVLKNNPEHTTVTKLAQLVSNPVLIKQGKIFPYQLDMANEVMLQEFSDNYSRQISQALAQGYAEAVPNLKDLMPGKNLVMLDRSGSMGTGIRVGQNYSRTRAIDKASLIAATIAKATNADIISFGSSAVYTDYNINQDVFSLGRSLANANMGGTNLAKAWNCAQNSGRKYDRVFILSDNECNQGSSYNSYMGYVENVGSPYVYSVDLAGYGTNCIAGDKVRYYYGYGFAMFEDIATSEFNANHHLDKVKQIII